MEEKPFFANIFKNKWEHLPIALKKRYANKTYSNDEVILDGVIDVKVSKLMRTLSPIFNFFGAKVPKSQKNMSIQVKFKSDVNSNKIRFLCPFRSTIRSPYYYNKKIGIIEFMKFGLGWKMNYKLDNNATKILHKGYIWRILGINIPMPFQLILGKVYASEKAVSDNEFYMIFAIKHRLFGEVFSYKGSFNVTKSPLL